jgi:hypothetical protein
MAPTLCEQIPPSTDRNVEAVIERGTIVIVANRPPASRRDPIAT